MITYELMYMTFYKDLYEIWKVVDGCQWSLVSSNLTFEDAFYKMLKFKKEEEEQNAGDN